MENLFLTVLNMSLTASYVIAFVILIRILVKKLPKFYSYALWFAVLFRLICPFSFDSIFSLIPKNVNIPHDIVFSQKPEISSGIAAIDSAVNKVLPAPPLNQIASANPMQIWLAIGAVVWIMGIALLLIYSVFTSVKLYRKLKDAKHMEENIYIINGFKTPFVFGVFNPKIYLPGNLLVSEKPYVLLHEQTHIKRLDHIVKLVFFIVTCIHWFNPLVWIAFYLMGEDMELSCDEKVVKQMGSNIKKEYSTSLLSMSIGRKIVGGSPIAFGENNTEGRIKNVLNYKKPTLWVLIIASIIIVVSIIALTSNPKPNEAIPWDRRPMIMVNGVLYMDTGREVSVEIDESAIIGEITSSVEQSEKPIEEGQSNFGNIGAKYAYFEDNIVVLLNNEWFLFDKEDTDKAIEDNNIYINEKLGFSLNFPKEWEDKYVIEESEDYISVFDKQIYDIDQGGLLFTIYRITGETVTQEDMDMEPVPTKIILQGNGYTYFYRLPSDVNYPINDEDLSKNYLEMREQIDYVVHGMSLLGVENDKSTIVSNKDKISSYLKEASINTFSLYYELLDFIISDYQEEVVDGNVEAIFSYTIVHKNYDRDPDTVQYIKEAKERGDKNYQTYYDEYLKSQDMNFYFKAVIDANDKITLYSKNPAIENDQWQQVEMSDYVINKITEEHESEKINRNEPIENDIAEHISYDYESRSIYIAGLKIFEEFSTEEFGFHNEGSARIIQDENALSFSITTATGTITGTLDGPLVYFKMNLDTNEIIEKKFEPGPNYEELGKTNFIKYSEKVIELSDERMIEIGQYFKEFILEIESKLDYFTYED